MPIKFTVVPTKQSTSNFVDDIPPEPPKSKQQLIQIKDFHQNHIRYHIHKNTAGPRKPRHHNVVHISDLDPSRNWCPREPALLTTTGKKRESNFISTAQSTVFRMGYKAADLLMDLIPPEQIWGHWKCRACKHQMKFAYTPHKCSKCGADREALKYQEVLVRDPATGVVGSVDCFVDILSNGKRTGVEIKSEMNDDFKSRTKATFDHEWRSKGYMYLMARDPIVRKKGVNLEEMRIMYISKGGWVEDAQIKNWPVIDSGKTAIKEYWCHRDDSVVANQFELATAYREWRKFFDEPTMAPSVPMPKRHKKCTSIGCTMASSCPVRKECWNPAK